MLDIGAKFSTDVERLAALNDDIAGQLAELAAKRIVELMTEFAPDEPRFIRAVKVPRPGPYDDLPPIIVEDEIAAVMREKPALVGVMVGRYTYDFSDREEERRKAAHTAVELGLILARDIWHARFKTQASPSP